MKAAAQLSRSRGGTCGSMKVGLGSAAAWVGIGTMAQDCAGFHWETLGSQRSRGTAVKCLNLLQSKLSLLLRSEIRVTAGRSYKELRRGVFSTDFPNFWTTLAVLAVSSLCLRMHRSSVCSYMCLCESIISS